MNAPKRTATAQLLLIFPAVLFMGALIVRQLTPPQDEPARTAHWIVMWFAGRVWTLWVLLITLPLAGFVTGCVTLARNWRDDLELRRAPRQTLSAVHAGRTIQFVAAMTMTAGVILAIVAMHMAAN